MNSLKTRLTMSAVIAALAAGALAAHADPEVEQPATAESRQSENFEQQPGMGSVASYTPSEHAGSAAASTPGQAEPSHIGIFHRMAESRPVRSFEAALHAAPKRPAISSPFDDPINTASPGG
jgi:hypothetical protein